MDRAAKLGEFLILISRLRGLFAEGVRGVSGPDSGVKGDVGGVRVWCRRFVLRVIDATVAGDSIRTIVSGHCTIMQAYEGRMKEGNVNSQRRCKRARFLKLP